MLQHVWASALLTDMDHTVQCMFTLALTLALALGAACTAAYQWLWVPGGYTSWHFWHELGYGLPLSWGAPVRMLHSDRLALVTSGIGVGCQKVALG